MTTDLYINNWDKWQSYRNDRGTPPWIKVHRNLLSNRKWAKLSDAEKGQMVSIWIVAADKNGAIPNDPLVLKKICQLDELPNLKKFKELGLLTVTPLGRPDAKLTPRRRQDDSPESETESETETESKKSDFLKFGIEKFLDDKSRQIVKNSVPGWDLYHLINLFDDFMENKPMPKNPVGAFVNWCKSYTKGKQL